MKNMTDELAEINRNAAIVAPEDIQILNEENEAIEEVDYKTKCQLLQNNLDSAYAKIRALEQELNTKTVKERSTDMLISQAVSVFSNTIMLAIKDKNN